MKKQQCLNCIFSSWYHNFKNVTFRSKIIPLSSEFVHYLNSDGIILPDSEDAGYTNDLEGYSDDEEWGHDDQPAVTPSFPDIKKQVDSAIKELGTVSSALVFFSNPS